ncbi:sporulation-specific protein [Stachybotrys elegans]|uniref:Sporulation-specific protein n=1 Tax=Stachybotrys elegans TaxID=80388 RepID=A0A8K0WW63_9HYPO|nr:sporulation-specific protein [Stachybotrys elegans]
MEANNSGHYIGRPAQGSHQSPGPADASTIMSSFAGMALGGPLNIPSSTHGYPLAPAPAFVLGPDGHYCLTPVQAAQQMPIHGNENMYQNFPVAPAGYPAPYLNIGHMPLMPLTPGRVNANPPRVERGHSDVPGLENRRGSYSTTESTPATPFYGGMSHRDSAPRVASLDRSTYTTPSPQQLGLVGIHTDAAPKQTIGQMPDGVLDELLRQNPAVPKAVPAVFTPPGQMKSLESSLENRIPGNRNVYIRGLHPTTDDELLFHFASRFGAVETSKAIIDTGTGACKGFGFAKFFDVHDSELCIRGFHRLGYEVGFARESFNSRLKAEGDEGSTNLYISNLPKNLTEMELGTIFLGFNILSSKILRDNMGNSRGVGFARFENRDICDEIIRKFNGIGIGEEGLLMNIRYADTPAQKELKRVTAERRQFRTNEYNIGAYGTPLVGMTPNLYNGQPTHWRRSVQSSRTTVGDSSRDGDVMRHSGSQRGNSQTTVSASTDIVVSTSNSSECDEGVTIHAEPVVVKSSQSSPIKKEPSQEDIE